MSDAKKPPLAEPAFETKRLRVFAFGVEPSDIHRERLLFVAFRTDEDRPMVAATMLCWHVPMLGGWTVCWHEVSSEHRRQRIATELRFGVEKYLGCDLPLEPGSREGEEFCAAIDCWKSAGWRESPVL